MTNVTFDSYASQVDDDGTPNKALDVAGQAVRDFNHRTITGMRPDRDGWQFAPDAYRALGELTYLAGGLDQTLQQVGAALAHELDRGRIKIDRGSSYEDNPAGAVAAASDALQRARQAAHAMYTAIADVQNAINAAAFNGADDK